jgi:hypothetical protein
MLYIGAWVICTVSFLIILIIDASARSYNEVTGHVVALHSKGLLVGYLTATESRLDLWTKTTMILSLIVCGFGPAVAARAGWFEPPANKPPRLWD